MCNNYSCIYSEMNFSLNDLDTPRMDLLHELIEAVADAQGKEPEQLEFVLEDYISMEAIQGLDEHKSDLWTLQFDLPNHTVQIGGDGTILVNDTEERAFR